MKKVLAILLALCAVVTFCACKGGNQETKKVEEYPGTFRAGYARRDITPTQSVPLAGFSNGAFRYSETFLDPVCATAVAITDETENTIIVLAMDTVKVADTMVAEARSKISEKLGIPADHITMAASHSHSAVDYTNQKDMYLTGTYVPWMTEQLIETCIEAYEDRVPTKMLYGSIEAEGLNFVRHYCYVNKDGEVCYFGDQYEPNGTAFDATTKHASDADPTMYLLQFKRENAKDIVLCNWRGHPHFTDGAAATNLSADYIGAFRDDMELTQDCNFVFFQGAAGNINTTSRIQKENKTKELHAFSALLTEYASTCLKNNMTELKGTKIQTKQYIYDAPYGTRDIEYASIASTCRQIFDTTGDKDAAMKQVEGMPIHSVYHAGAIASRAKSVGKKDQLELDVYSIGDELAIGIAPHEMFDTNTQWLEENSPYKATLFFGYANQNRVYCPSIQAIEYGCYEADITRWEDGTAEKEMQFILDIMNEFHK